jgi:hypothetical protein
VNNMSENKQEKEDKPTDESQQIALEQALKKEESEKARKKAENVKKAEEKEAKAKAKAEKEAAKQAEKERKAEAKKKKAERREGITKLDYDAIPDYFVKPAEDPETRSVQQLQAIHWFAGTGSYQKGGKSFSAKITYLGPRRFMSREIKLGKRSIVPNAGNWKIFVGSARLRRGEEFGGDVKDAQYIHDLLTTPGGKKNFKVRFVEDEPLQVKKEKKRFLSQDVGRILALPYHMRKSRILQGLKIPLRPGEAAQILQEISKEGLPKSSKDIAKYLNELIKKEDTATAVKKSKED